MNKFEIQQEEHQLDKLYQAYQNDTVNYTALLNLLKHLGTFTADQVDPVALGVLLWEKRIIKVGKDQYQVAP